MPDVSIQRVRYGSDPNQFFDFWEPDRTCIGTAVMIHGGFWRAKYGLGHANPICAALAAKGVATASLEYRRVGQVGGGWPGTFEDVIKGVSAASETLGSPPVVIGHSAGGHLGLLLASGTVPLRAVIALAPIADLRLAYQLNLSNGAVVEFLGGTPEVLPERYDEACPSTHDSSVPRVVVHDTGDEDVPIKISRAFIEGRRNDAEPPLLIEIRNAKHMDLIDPESKAGAQVIEIVLRSLGTP